MISFETENNVVAKLKYLGDIWEKDNSFTIECWVYKGIIFEKLWKPQILQWKQLTDERVNCQD